MWREERGEKLRERGTGRKMERERDIERREREEGGEK